MPSMWEFLWPPVFDSVLVPWSLIGLPLVAGVWIRWRLVVVGSSCYSGWRIANLEGGYPLLLLVSPLERSHPVDVAALFVLCVVVRVCGPRLFPLFSMVMGTCRGLELDAGARTLFLFPLVVTGAYPFCYLGDLRDCLQPPRLGLLVMRLVSDTPLAATLLSCKF